MYSTRNKHISTTKTSHPIKHPIKNIKNITNIFPDIPPLVTCASLFKLFSCAYFCDRTGTR